MNDLDDFADELRLEKLYEEGRRLFLARRLAEALEQFKRVYEVDCRFRNVFEIVEDYFSMPEDQWYKKFKVRLLDVDK